MMTRLPVLCSGTLLALSAVACRRGDGEVAPPVVEEAASPVHERVQYIGEAGLPPVAKGQVLVVALDGGDLPAGFQRAGDKLVLKDDVPTAEAPHKVIGLMTLRDISLESSAEDIINGYVEAGRRRGATAVVHHGCRPLTKQCKATAVRLSTATPPEDPQSRPTPTATWAAPTNLPAVPAGRAVNLPVSVDAGAIGGLENGAVVVGSSGGDDEDTHRWVGRVAKDGKLEAKDLGRGTLVDVQTRPDGGTVLAGTTYPPKTILQQVGNVTISEEQEVGWIGHLAPDGKPVWEQAFPAAFRGGPSALALPPGGGAAVVGGRASRVIGVPDPFLMTVNARGEKAWDGTFVQARDQLFGDVAVLASGRLLAVGAIRTTDDYDRYDAWLVLAEPGGEVVANRGLDRPGWNQLDGVTGIWDGGAVAVGRCGATRVSGRDRVGSALVVRLNADGKTVWAKQIGEQVVAVTDVVEVKGGTMFAATKLEKNSRLSSSLVTVDLDGNDTWQPIQMGADFEVKDLAATPNGGLALLGRKGKASRQIWVGVSGPR